MKPVYPIIYDRLYFYYDYSSKQSFQSLSKQAACFIDKSRIPYTVIRSSPRFEIVLRNTYSQRKVRGGPNFCPPYIFSKWTKYGIWTKAFWSKGAISNQIQHVILNIFKHISGSKFGPPAYRRKRRSWTCFMSKRQKYQNIFERCYVIFKYHYEIQSSRRLLQIEERLKSTYGC